MTISMYAASHGVFTRALQQLLHVLEKGAANAQSRGFDVSVLFNSRLAPDMLPLSRQVQLTSDFAKNSIARLIGKDPPKYDDTEANYGELLERVKKTLAYLESVPASAFENSESRDIQLKLRDRTLEFKGLEYLQVWVLPNFFFHHVTTYNILRHNGVDVGKRDFLGR